MENVTHTSIGVIVSHLECKVLGNFIKYSLAIDKNIPNICTIKLYYFGCLTADLVDLRKRAFQKLTQTPPQLKLHDVMEERGAVAKFSELRENQRLNM